MSCIPIENSNFEIEYKLLSQEISQNLLKHTMKRYKTNE